jgi:hypothetical protein
MSVVGNKGLFVAGGRSQNGLLKKNIFLYESQADKWKNCAGTVFDNIRQAYRPCRLAFWEAFLILNKTFDARK